ncbi:hypothetical protein PSGK_18990 [Pseudomonas solani]|uniref:hypothetical protein n=1 Tax=Pseudomonas solani TaxID=2731552 RepID=UPI0035BE8FC1
MQQPENSKAPERAQQLAITPGAIQPLRASIACDIPFHPQPGTVEDCLNGSSNLLAGCVHLAHLIANGDPHEAEETGHCLSFLLAGAKALVDTANSQLLRGGQPFQGAE